MGWDWSWKPTEELSQMAEVVYADLHSPMSEAERRESQELLASIEAELGQRESPPAKEG